MAKKRKGNFKKTPAQLQDYREFISNSSTTPSGTVPVTNELLQGSGEYGYDDGKLESTQKVTPVPVKYRIEDWLKKNIFPTIVSTILIAIGTAVIIHQVNLAVVSKQVEYIEKRIEQIEDEYVDKETLQLKLNEVTSHLDASYSLTLNDIKWQLREIESKVDAAAEP